MSVNINNNGTLTPISGVPVGRLNTAEANIGDLANLTTTDKSSLVDAINEVDSKAIGHVIKDSNGVSYTQRTNLVFDNLVVQDDSTNDATIVASAGTAIMIGNVSNATATRDFDTVTLTWNDPNDTTISDITVEWAGTTVVRKIGSAPTSVSDGTVVLTNTTRNQYSNSGYVDRNLVFGNTYYYRFFPYKLNGSVRVHTNGSTVSVYTERITISDVPSQSGTLTYDGSLQSPTWSNYDSSQLTIGGDTSGTNAGSYTATFTPKMGYQWSGANPYDAKSITWSIDKTVGAVTLSSNSESLDSSTPTATITVSGATGDVSIASSDTSVATVSPASLEAPGGTFTIIGVAGASGSATVTVSVASSTNYEATSDTISVTADIGITIKPWSTATDAELKEVVDAYYAGSLSLSDIQAVWSIGDERTVNLSAMSATGVGESHVAQNVTMVIMNFGGKKLSSDGTTDVLAIVGQKNFLANGTSGEYGYMNSSNTNAGGWNSCARRTWCNNVYKNAIPTDFRALFKQFNNITANGDGSTTVTSADYFALPSEKEVFGSTTYANATAETGNTQFDYYKTAANRIKNAGDNGSAQVWWERSPFSGYFADFCRVSSDGSAGSYSASSARGLAPFGCI